jgi:pantoate--beta-alanine ligase
MDIVASIDEMQRIAEDLRLQRKRIGVVPTMGYLHEGHLSLIRNARTKADVVITTIFVNPTQFSLNEDFSKYPRDLERDKQLAESAGTDFLFTPTDNEMYPEGYQSYVQVEDMTKVLEGKSRPTHFRGVTTVVAKLFHITKPHVAVFGQKDAQQAAVIKQMVKDLDFDIDIVVGPIVRENDGLAMSSRNVYLSSEERSEATVLYQSLKLAENLIQRGERNSVQIVARMSKLITSKLKTQIDYISIADAQTLQELRQLRSGDTVLISLAVRVGSTRLIDNIQMTIR